MVLSVFQFFGGKSSFTASGNLVWQISVIVRWFQQLVWGTSFVGQITQTMLLLQPNNLLSSASIRVVFNGDSYWLTLLQFYALIGIMRWQICVSNSRHLSNTTFGQKAKNWLSWRYQKQCVIALVHGLSSMLSKSWFQSRAASTLTYTDGKIYIMWKFVKGELESRVLLWHGSKRLANHQQFFVSQLFGLGRVIRPCCCEQGAMKTFFRQHSIVFFLENTFLSSQTFDANTAFDFLISTLLPNGAFYRVTKVLPAKLSKTIGRKRSLLLRFGTPNSVMELLYFSWTLSVVGLRKIFAHDYQFSLSADIIRCFNVYLSILNGPS